MNVGKEAVLRVLGEKTQECAAALQEKQYRAWHHDASGQATPTDTNSK